MKKKIKKSLPGLILIFSALILGILTIVLIAKTRVHVTITEDTPRTIAGSYPEPSELIEADKITYFSSVQIPDMIFTKMQGVSFPEDCPVSRDDLRYMSILYWGTDNASHKGELIVNAAIADDIADIFFKLYQSCYPIESIRLVDEFGGNDEVSMADNNTSCFNGRKINGSDTWSYHAYGLAIDINPLYNPYVGADGTILPVTADKYADRTTDFPMKIDENDYAYKLFTAHGFTWGGNFDGVKDYQHFEKAD